MRKIFLIKKLSGNKSNVSVKERKPLEIYDLATGEARPLFAVADKVVYRSSGAFGGEVITEVTNEYGVVFRKRTPVMF